MNNNELPAPLVNRLWKHAKPWSQESPAAVVERILQFYEDHNPSEPTSTEPRVQNGHSPDQKEELRQLDPLQPPSFAYTRVRGQFAGVNFVNWNHLLEVAHVKAFAKYQSFEQLQSATSAQVKMGSYHSDGYHYVPSIGLSIQGVDADRAWAYSLKLARRLQVPINAEVEWRRKTDVADLGDRASISWTPA